MEKDFDRWNTIKKATDAADETARLYFREGEVWWVRLGKNIGYETDGKSREFTRPVIILKKYNQYSFLASPLTTAQKPNPLYVANCSANEHMLLSSEENGESLSSLWRMSPCGRLGPVFQAPLFRLDGILGRA
jgi:hypothetical protein